MLINNGKGALCRTSSHIILLVPQTSCNEEQLENKRLKHWWPIITTGNWLEILIVCLSCPYRVRVGEPEGKRLLGRPRRRWVNNIKIDLRETGWHGMDWIDLAKDRNQ
jgi:hypothetical protein